MRRALTVLLVFGVVGGFGSAIASVRHHRWHHGGGCHEWERGEEWGRPAMREAPAPAPAAPVVVAPAPAPAAAPVNTTPIIVNAPAPAAAAAPNVFIVMPGAAQPVQVVPAAPPAPAHTP